MQAERHKIVDGKKVEEFYWNGKMIVYIGGRKTNETYDEIQPLRPVEKKVRKAEQCVKK